LLRLQIRENRMNVHKNARLTPHGRERIVRQVESGQTPKAVGEAAGVGPQTVRKWVFRYQPSPFGREFLRAVPELPEV
jgi:transposase-like protein